MKRAGGRSAGTTMRRLAGCLASCVTAAVVCLAIAPGVPLAQGSSSGEESGSSSSLGGPLVIPGSPAQGEQLQAAEAVRRANPQAVAARQASRTAFAGRLSTGAAAKLASKAFPATIGDPADPAGGPPRLPAGERITGYPSDNAAQIELPGGKHAIIESLEPLAIETSHGQREPLDLDLTEAGGAFQPVRSAVDVRIPKRLADGVQLANTGVSLTPVAANGAALGGAEGAVDGASVLYANTQTDADTLVKPLTSGFAEDTLLRSVNSPSKLSFRVVMPAGASLVPAKGGAKNTANGVDIVADGTVIAAVPAPSAQDAEGVAVPVSMSASGDTLTVSVDRHAGEYRYPIEVDPNTVTDWVGSEAERKINDGYGGNWLFYNGSGSQWEGGWYGGESMGIRDSIGRMNAGEWAYLYYLTQGASEIYSWTTEVKDSAEGSENTITVPEMYIESEKSKEEGHSSEGARVVLPRNETNEATACARSGCAVPGSVESGRGANGAFFEGVAEKTGISYARYEAVNPRVSIVQYAGPWSGFDTTDKYIKAERKLESGGGIEEEGPNPLYGGGQWVNGHGNIGFEATDPGVGVDKLSWKSPTESKWSESREGVCKGKVQCLECLGPECSAAAPETTPVSGFYGETLLDGEDEVQVTSEDAVGLTATAKATVKVDTAAPHSITLAGWPAGGETGDGQQAELKLRGGATDGSGAVRSSGVASLALSIDGKAFGSPSGSCSPGPCTATSNEWALNTSEYAAGKHTFTVTATDNAGNVAKQNFTLTIHHAHPVAFGPGLVNPLSGELHLGATDVSAAGTGTAMTVSGSYNSRHLSAGAEGPLGPQWSMSVGGEQSIVKLATGSVMLTNSSGQQVTFTSTGGGKFASPAGDASLTLTETTIGEKPAFTLKSGGTVTTFEHPGGGSESVWMPAITEGAGGTNASTFTYQTVEVEGKKITEPTEELAPVPSGVSCSPTLSKGCRALTFSYATSTTATGESPSEWGNYHGRLASVSFTAWEPVKKEVKTSAIAQYSYDKQGRLRAKWNPLISPALKTEYGYDTEGHVTAVNPPGQQPWLLHYGTTIGDANTGRLLSVTRPSASTALGSGSAPANTAVPTLSSTKPVVGTKIGVSSNGTWTGTPLAYSYQWQDCNSAGGECSGIPGAVNQSYYPAKTDEGHTLRAQVAAVNAGGTVSASSAATSTVATGTPNNPAPEPPNPGTSSVWTIDYNVPASGTGAPYALGAKEAEAWGQKDDPAEATAVFPPDEPEGWPAKDYKRASIEYFDGHNRVVNAAAPSGAIATSEYNETNDLVRTLSPDNRAAALKEGSKSAEVSKLLDTESAYNSEGNELQSTLGPQHTVKLSNGSTVEARDHKQYYYDEGAPSEGGPYRLVTKVTEGAQYSGKEADVRTTTTSYSGEENLGWELRKATSVTTDPGGLNLTHTTFYEPSTGDVTETRLPAAGSSGLPAGAYTYSAQVMAGGSPDGVAVDSAGHLWVLGAASDRVNEMSATGELLTAFGTEGAGDGQFKKPQGVAIDTEGHVWVADTGNNRVQELSSTGSFIRAFGSEGTEAGELNKPTALAVNREGDVWVADTENRRIEEFSSTGAYITKATTLGKPEGITFDSKGDVWVATASYVWEYSSNGETLIATFGGSGSENGKFKEAAGLIVSGEDLYVVDRGNSRVQEFKITEKEGKTSAEYVSQFGASGAGNGQFKEPQGIALDKEGNVWVADAGNNRTQKFTAAGKYVTQTAGPPGGVAVDSGGHVWVADAEGNRVEELSSTGEYITGFGTEGTGDGQFKKPQGVAIDAEGHVWVADTGNNRVQELAPTGGFIRAFGSEGTETGRFKRPTGIAIDSSRNVWVADTENNRVQEFSSTGSYLRSSEAGELKSPEGIASDAKGDVWVADTGSILAIELSSTASKIEEFISSKEPAGIAVSGKYIYVVNRGSDRVREYVLSEKEGKTSVEYVSEFGTSGGGNGQFKEPQGIAFDKEGHAWVADVGNGRIQEFGPAPVGARDTQTIYYRAGAYLGYPNCGEHPEWANLPCQTQPAEQPETSGLPNLPVTTGTYNIWDEPETTTETVGSAQHAPRPATYDAAGRLKTTATSSTVGTALPRSPTNTAAKPARWSSSARTKAKPARKANQRRSQASTTRLDSSRPTPTLTKPRRRTNMKAKAVTKAQKNWTGACDMSTTAKAPKLSRTTKRPGCSRNCSTNSARRS